MIHVWSRGTFKYFLNIKFTIMSQNMHKKSFLIVHFKIKNNKKCPKKEQIFDDAEIVKFFIDFVINAKK